MMTDEATALSGHESSQSKMMEELCLLVDEDDVVIGNDSKLGCHHGEGIRHRAFSVLIFDSENRLLVQQRSSDKITFPSVWANSCCSHPLDIVGENGIPEEGVKEAARRKLEQELGISREITNSWDFNHIGRFEYRCRWDDEWVEHEIDHVMIVKSDVAINFNRNEIQATDWIDNNELIDMMEHRGRWKNQLIAPWFEQIIANFFPNGSSIDDIIKNPQPDIIRCGELSVAHPDDSAANVLAALTQHRDRVETEIMESLSRMDQKNLHDAMVHLFQGGGKRMRAILPRLVGEAVGEAHDGHYTLGAAIEIIHNFTLIHDDIMDQDPIRRGLDAVHIHFDEPTAICAGDAMLAIGFEMLGESKHIPGSDLARIIRAIGYMVRMVAKGQQEDMEFESRSHVSEEEYIEMIKGKTSAMFEICSETGAILAGADIETIELMAKWGLNLGLCFQIMDDYIDMTSDTETLGKPAGSDIVQGKMTLIAIHALESGADMPNFRKLFGTREDSEELDLAVRELKENGSIQYALDRALHHHKMAHDCLDSLEQSSAVDILRDMTDFQLVRIN
ncbi:MAG TPA: isopentenyl-diphosphate delta-isomerase [Candidatus Thalassarchaeaceae archaeon]|jgi:geranylgeranyl diphosphate synthase type I|nr:isopentenyl-diphosphate delta-isomerase [Candidatus Thalassarchaeaceae archaeon]